MPNYPVKHDSPPPSVPRPSLRPPSPEQLLGGITGFFKSVAAALRANPERWLMFVLCAGAAMWLFVMLGSDSDVTHEGKSIFKWFAVSWRAADYKHSPIMLLFAGFVVWMKRKELAAAESSYSLLGVLGAAVFLMAHIVGYAAQLPRVSLGASVLVFWCVVWAVWGWKVARILWFPAAYILLCFCGSLMMDLTMILRLWSAWLACGMFYCVGIAATSQGTVVTSLAREGYGFQFDVAGVCSGLRTLIVMTALSAPYAYFMMRCGVARKLFLFALSVPLAIATNALRIFTLGIVAKWFGMKIAMDRYHDMSGFLVLIFSITLLKLTGYLLEKDWGKTLCEYKLKIKNLRKHSPD